MLDISNSQLTGLVTGATRQTSYMYRLNPDKHYHTLQHVDTMLELCLQNAAEIGKCFPELATAEGFRSLVEAILWHDADYRIGAKDNEIRAAALYTQNMGVHANIDVAKAILSTMIGNWTFNSGLAMVLHDLDYHTFRDEDLMHDAEELLYGEYLEMVKPDGADPRLEDRREFLKHQISFYRTLQERDVFVSIFATYNIDAQKNIQDRINSMEDAISILNEDIERYNQVF